MTRVLCVAEKPSIAKAVAGHLSGGQLSVARTLSSLVGIDTNLDSSSDWP